MRYIEKKIKLFNRVIILRQRKKKSRGLNYQPGLSFAAFHVWRWSVYLGKKTGNKPIFNI